MHLFRYSLVLLSALAVVAVEAGPITSNHYRLATSITAPLGDTFYDDHQAVTRTPGAHGALPDLDAYAWSRRIGLNAFMVRDHQLIFVPDTSFTQGATTYTRRDLVAFDPATSTFTKYFDGLAAGIPARAGIDAITPGAGAGAFHFSLDIPATLPDVGAVRQYDVVFWNGSDKFSVTLAGFDDLNLPPAANINALHLSTNNVLYFSLDKPWEAGRERDVWRVTDLLAPAAKLFTGELLTTPGVDVVGLDFPRDADGDGLTDFEEITGLNEPSSVLPGSTVLLDPEGNTTDPLDPDTDGDGFTDAEEALAGTDPNDEEDYLRFLGIRRETDQDIVTWRSSASRVYLLESITENDGDLINPDWQLVVEIPGAGADTVFTNTLINIERHMYRLQLRLDP